MIIRTIQNQGRKYFLAEERTKEGKLLLAEAPTRSEAFLSCLTLIKENANKENNRAFRIITNA
jgi:hypothetical protein